MKRRGQRPGSHAAKNEATNNNKKGKYSAHQVEVSHLCCRWLRVKVTLATFCCRTFDKVKTSSAFSHSLIRHCSILTESDFTKMRSVSQNPKISQFLRALALATGSFWSSWNECPNPIEQVPAIISMTRNCWWNQSFAAQWTDLSILTRWPLISTSTWFLELKEPRNSSRLSIHLGSFASISSCSPQLAHLTHATSNIAFVGIKWDSSTFLAPSIFISLDGTECQGQVSQMCWEKQLLSSAKHLIFTRFPQMLIGLRDHRHTG